MANASYYTLSEADRGKLIFVKHAESEWNKLGKWTGLADVHSSPKRYVTICFAKRTSYSYRKRTIMKTYA